ncbi:pyrroline-5-carboxylate reductase [Filifactor villosus]|uniref:Pyrroline-5-carboxylate reductase n=1 Tax=Filifactor villosus TaxID=29374 RepID=A0ABV9QIU8_9FIRM
MKLGFIGCGNMAKAIIEGILSSELLFKEDIVVSALHSSTLEEAKRRFGVHTSGDNREVAENADCVILAVKPYLYEEVIHEISPVVDKSKIVVSIAPGKTLKQLKEWFGREVKLVRTMPNTPCTVGEGMTAICFNDRLDPKEVSEVKSFFEACGRVEEVSEDKMDAVVAVSGSSPAYIFVLIEAMADAAVLEGMSRAQAYLFASQAVLGSAKMVLESGLHPAKLKDGVCSPGGTTIEAVRILEEKGFRSSVIEAMIACAKKSSQM